MLRFNSLSTRLIIAVVATATIAFAASFGLTIVRLDRGLERQAEQLGRLSEEKLAQRLDGEARLAGARLEGMLATTGTRLESIAQRADVVKAISSANVVAISELLGRAAEAADIDGIVVVDSKLRMFGAASDKVDIVVANRELQESPLAKDILAILTDNDRKHPHTLRRAVAMNEQLAAALGASDPSPLTFVVAEPIFDDFGDVFAGLIAHRSLRPREAALEEFSRLEGAGLLVVAGNESISVSGIPAAAASIKTNESSLLGTKDGLYWSRCEGLLGDWRACALAPVGELHALRNELIRVGEAEGRSLAVWLIGAAIASVLLFAGIMLLVSQRISRPLVQITEAVRAVARGDWKSEVTGTHRVDEVGDIARAVTVLQRSLQERDRLRNDVAHAESVKKRREALEDAIRRFDRIMRSVLLSVSNSVETMDETARELARVSAVAEGEAVEAAFVSESTVTNFSALRSATERLSAALSETVDGIRQATEVIALSNTVAQSASTSADDLARTATEIDAVLTAVADIAAQTNALALNATIQAARAAKGSGNFGIVVGDIKTLAGRIGEANDDITRRLGAIRGATGETVGSVRSIVQKLDMVLHQTRT
ncbi:MAG: methyl-accepting chemotaxis protein, partial [Alphaproteobacteria bacterium]|nr:methyl-accepting chemotaxis protein [Alphaproteobacteria bacterium]